MHQNIESYQPEPDEVKKNKIRKIYSYVSLDPDEEETLNKFRAYVQKHSVSLPEWVDDEHRFALKMMESTKRKPKEAVKLTFEYIEWLNSMPVPLTDDVQNLLNQGTVYVTGMDYKFHPVIVVNQRRLINSQADLDLVLRVNYVVLNWIMENMIVPGKVETWSIIMDSTDVSTRQMEMSKLKKLANNLSNYYPCRLNKSYQVNTPSALYRLWQVLSMFLASDTKQKVVIMKDNFAEVLRNEIPPHYLEEKYGGDRPNLESGFFPPSNL